MSDPSLKHLKEDSTVQRKITAIYRSLGLAPPELSAFTVTDVGKDEDTGADVLTLTSPCGQVEVEVTEAELEESLKTIN